MAGLRVELEGVTPPSKVEFGLEMARYDSSVEIGGKYHTKLILCSDSRVHIESSPRPLISQSSFRASISMFVSSSHHHPIISRPHHHIAVSHEPSP